MSGVKFCWFVRGAKDICLVSHKKKKISASGLEDHMIQIAAKGIEFDGIVAGCLFFLSEKYSLLGEIS